MTGTISITSSDMAAWMHCRRSFTLSYIEDWKEPEIPYGALALGSRVHRALEHYNRGAGDPIAEHQRIALEDEAEMRRMGAPSWAIDQLYEDIIVGRNCVIAFLEWVAAEGPYHGYTVAGVESKLEHEILGGRVKLMGKADLLLARDVDGAIFTDDYKTSNRFRSGLRENLERSFQHHTYLTLLRLLKPDVQIAGAFYTVLFKAKNMASMKGPAVERFRAPATTRMAELKLRQIEAICTDILNHIDRVASEGPAVAYPTPQDSCRWCPFRNVCELMDDSPVAARALLDAKFERGGRHKRYKEFEEFS